MSERDSIPYRSACGMAPKDTVSYFDLPVLRRRKIIYQILFSWFAHCGVIQFEGESIKHFFFASLDGMATARAFDGLSLSYLPHSGA